MPLWPTGAVKLVPRGVGVTEPPWRILANLSVPMGGGTFLSGLVLPDFGWPKLAGAEAAERGEDDPEETDGIGDSPATGLVETRWEGGLKPGALELSG